MARKSSHLRRSESYRRNMGKMLEYFSFFLCYFVIYFVTDEITFADPCKD